MKIEKGGLPFGGDLFDVVLGRNVFTFLPTQIELLEEVKRVLRPGGRLALVQRVPRRGQRLSAFLSRRAFDEETWARLRAAEEALFTDPSDPMTAWDVADLRAALEAAGFSVEEEELLTLDADIRVTRAHVRRWLDEDNPRSYIARVAHHLSAKERNALRDALVALVGQNVRWQSVAVIMAASA